MTLRKVAWASARRAKDALARWPARWRGPVRTIQVGENASYLVRGAAGKAVLRLYRPGRWTGDQIQVEHDFMGHLGRRLGVEPPLPGRDNETLQALGDGRYAALVPFLEGRLVRAVKPRHLREVGRMTGRLHRRGAAFAAAAGRDPWDQETMLAVTAKMVRKHWRRRLPEVPPPELGPLIRRARARWRRVGGAVGMCHADLHWGNLKFHKGAVRVFDFDDCGPAPLAYDLAVTLYASVREPAELDGFLGALLEGYAETAAAPISGEAVVFFRWVRNVMLLGWILEREDVFGDDYLRRRVVPKAEWIVATAPEVLG